MEVLDNLAHDKVTMCETSGTILQGEIQYPDKDKSVKDKHQNELEEIFAPLSDDLLQHVLNTQPSYLPASPLNSGAKWIPTVACGMIRSFLESRPNCSAILADFDWLPPPQFESRSIQTRRSLQAEFEPLVTCMDDVDHICYLNSPNKLYDILYPTNFAALNGYIDKLLLDYQIESTVSFMKQNDFLFKYGKDEVDETRGMLGFTPLLEDFSNCSVLTIMKGI